MILWMDQGRSNKRIAHDLQLNRGTVRYWRARWLELMPTLEALPAEALPAEALPAEALPAEALPAEALPAEALPAEALPAEALSADKTLARRVESALQDEARCGAPLRFSAEAVVGIVALACEDPQNSGRPVSHWSAREVADEAQKRGLVDSISPRTVERFLKAVGSSPPQS